MDRVHYRRYTPSRLRSSLPEPEPSGGFADDHFDQQSIGPREPVTKSYLEKLIVQGIISGIILAVVLAVNMTDHPRIQTSLNQAISSHVTAEQVAAEFNRFLGGWDLPAVPLGPFGPIDYAGPEIMDIQETGRHETISHEANQTNQTNRHGTEIQTEIQTETQTENHSETLTPRIDQDVLQEAFGYEGDNIQITAPEPMILPEL